MILSIQFFTDTGREMARSGAARPGEIFMARRESMSTSPEPRTEQPSELLRELVAHLRQNRTQLREEWVVRISETRLLTAMTKEEIFAEATSVYDSYVEALETEAFEALQAYARNLSERIIPRGVETHEVVGIVLLLRDVLARSLFAKYQNDFKKLNRILDAYEPAANRIANTVAVGFVQERERVIRGLPEAILALAPPVLPVRHSLAQTDLSAHYAPTHATIGVAQAKVTTPGDLQGDSDPTGRQLGYQVASP